MLEASRQAPQAPPRRPSPLTPFVPWVLLAAFAALLSYGVYALHERHEQLSRSVRVVGEVRALERSSSNDGDTYFSVVDYAYDGRTYTYRTAWSANPPMHAVGERVALAHFPPDPARTTLLTFMTTDGFILGFAIAPGLVGILCCLGAIFGDRAMRALYPHLF